MEFFFGGLPAIVAFALIVVNNLLVYWHVRTTTQRSIRRFQASVTRAQGTNLTSVSTENGSSRSKRSRFFGSMGRRRSAAARPTGLGDLQLQRVRAVANQAFFYVAAFMITYLPAGIVRILAGFGMGAEDEGQLFPLLVLQALLLPSQGLFNVLVYIRPSFWRVRQDYPDETRLWAFRRALYGEGIKATKDRDRVRRHHSSSDFGGLIVRGLDGTRGGSVLQMYGMADEYPPNYWRRSEDEDIGQELEWDESTSHHRGPENLMTTEGARVMFKGIGTDGNDGREVGGRDDGDDDEEPKPAAPRDKVAQGTTRLNGDKVTSDKPNRRPTNG